MAIGVLYVMLNDIDVWQSVTDKFKAGYWFTVTLFEFYVLHDMVKLLACKRQWMYDVLLVVMALVCYALAVPSMQRLYGDVTIVRVLGVAQWKYFLFFVLGMLVRRNKQLAESEKSGFVLIMAFLLVYCGNAIVECELSGVWFNINLLMQEATIVLLVYYVFSKRSQYFSSKTRVGRTLCKVGTNTLEIYLLHYFVLPRHLHSIIAVNGLIDNPLLASFVVAFVAAIVVGIVLLVCGVLQANGYMKRLLWNK